MGTTPADRANIRIMTRGDLSAVAAVEQDAFPAPWPEKTFTDELDNPLAVYLVLEIAGKVCGYAGFWQILDEAQVTNIALLTGWRGRGLGKQLVAALLDEAARHNARTVFLEVRPSNLTAQKLYTGQGFTACGRRTGYYQDNGEDALIMKKTLAIEENDE